MSEPVRSAHPGQNRLLLLLPPPERAQLARQCVRVAFRQKQVLYEPLQLLTEVYFPLSGVVSLVATTDDGGVELAMVGNEGLVGSAAFLEAQGMPFRSICQSAVEAERLPAAALVEAATQLPALHRLLGRYTQALLVQVGLSAACNVLHPSAQRCARWLLQMQDRVAADTFPLTQELLAQMLGVRRATVTEAVGRLHQRGLIRYRWGVLTIVDRAGLEATACGCYARIAAEFDALLPRT